MVDLFHVLVFLTVTFWVSLDVMYTITCRGIQPPIFVGIAFPEHDGELLPGEKRLDDQCVIALSAR
jgi:hypothetical protein